MPADHLLSTYCPQCGQRHEVAARFCQYCGQAFSPTATSSRGSSPSFAPSRSSLEEVTASFDDAQRRAFSDQQITFETVGQTHAAGGAMMPQGGGVAMPIMMVGQTKTRWTAFLGRQEISETEFFRVVGDEPLMKRSLDRETTNAQRRLWGGVATAIGGLIFFSTMFSSWAFENYKIGLTIMAPGGLILAAGFGFLMTGIMAKTQNLVPLNVVTPLAEQYNLVLARKISKL